MNYIKQLLVAVLLMVLMNACNTEPSHGKSLTKEEEKEILIAQIDSLEAVFAKTGFSDSFTVSKLITGYTEFRNKYRGDSLASEYFYEAGVKAMGANKWEKAAEVFKNWFNENGTSPKSDEVLYQLAGIYDLWLNREDEAKQTYEHYLKLYPDSSQAGNAAARLRDIGIPLEDLVKGFKEKNNVE